MEDRNEDIIDSLEKLRIGNDYDAFIDKYSSALESGLEINEHQIIFFAAEAYKRKFMIEEARAAYKKLVETDIRYVLYFSEFVNEFAKDQIPYAIDLLKKVLQVTPSESHQWNICIKIASSYEAIWQYDEAAKFYFQASSLGSETNRSTAFDLMKVAIVHAHEKSLNETGNVYEAKTLDLNLHDHSHKKHKESQIGQIKKWHYSENIKFFPIDMDHSESISSIIHSMVNNTSRLPGKSIFSGDSKIMTFGSCFARNIRIGLSKRGFKSSNIEIPEELNNTSAVRNFLEWCFTGACGTPSEAYRTRNGDIELFDFGADNSLHKNALMQADCIIMTYGVGEIWKNRQTGGVFWHGIPASIYDPAVHEATISTSSWNAENIRKTISIVREYCGDVPIFLTLSPIPLNATFRDVSIWEADCASKSVIRSAIEEIMNENYPGVYYWPSFEIVRWVGAHLKNGTFSHRDAQGDSFADARHVRDEIISEIINIFIDLYFSRNSLEDGA